MPIASTATLVLFARDPDAGPAKTRLAAAIGKEAALAVYRAMLAAIIARASAWPVARRVIALTPDDASAAFSTEAPRWDAVIPQGAGSLGERLARAQLAAEATTDSPVIFIGADSPDLPIDRVVEAGAISSAQAYFVPAADGGYCLLSVRRPSAALFEGIDWGTPRVLEQSQAAARRAGLQPIVGRSWQDVDTVADLSALQRRIANATEPALLRLRDELKRITLPQTIHSPGATMMMETTAKHAATVLIADDNPQIVELLEAYLEALPLRTVSAADGEAALKAVSGERPDLLLLDIMMPRCSGFEVCRRLKADPAHKDLPIIVITALNEVTDEERARDSGADVFISKPVNKIELLNHIRRLLADKLPPE